MKKWLKRIRGVLGTGLTWAAAWSVVGTIIWGVPYVIGGSPLDWLLDWSPFWSRLL